MSSRCSRHACAMVFLVVLCGCSQRPAPGSASLPRTVPPAAAAPTAAAPGQSPAIDLTRNDLDAPPSLTDADIPPLPVTPFPAARPMEIVQAVYVFAARHPEVLSKVPCFCGCESRSHRHNDDCFVAARDARGRPTAWEPHGVG